MKCPECNDSWFDSDVFCYRCGYVETEDKSSVFNAIIKIYSKIKAFLKKGVSL